MDFLKTKFDSLCFVFLILVLVGVMMWFQDKADDKVVAWFQQTITTVLGAYIGITQAARMAWKGNGGTNGSQNGNITPSVVPDGSGVRGTT